MSKKYMIRCDVDGSSGVVSFEQVDPGKSEYAFGKAMFMADLLALISGLNDGGAESIVLYDEHFLGRNIVLDELPENVTVFSGKPPYRKGWAGGLDESFDGLILCGFHSKSGTPGALLNHTYEPDIKNLLLNGVSVGEIGMEAAIAGDHSVSLILITGDSAGVAEAIKLVPDVKGVAVKESMGETSALCYPLQVTRKMIYHAAKEIGVNPPASKPYRLTAPICLQVELADGPFRHTFENLFAGLMVDGLVTIGAGSATEAWASYWEKKLLCYAAMEADQ